MSLSATPSLPHRSVSSIRGQGGAGAAGAAAAAAGPHTPSRPLPTTGFGSPTGARAAADDDLVIAELGSRKLRIGFAGDPLPKRVASFRPEQHRRAGDFRAWDPDFPGDWRKRSFGKPWGSDHELWQLDVRRQDLALVGDRLEHELRDAYNRYLLVDSKPKRLSLVLPPTMPIPLLSSVLDTLFNRFATTTVSLLSSPVMATLAAGTRSALVVDFGWHETTVTAVYEYREVHTWRTVRAGKRLVDATYSFLAGLLDEEEEPPPPGAEDGDLYRGLVSFEECQEVASRVLWCKESARKPRKPEAAQEGLPTVEEHEETEEEEEEEEEEGDEVEEGGQTEEQGSRTTEAPATEPPVSINLNSCKAPQTVSVPFSRLSEPCENTFFETQFAPTCFDDHELPIHWLIYRALLQLPLDIRAMCMSRIIFTGGCSSVAGLKARILDEVSVLVEDRGWEAVRGKAAEEWKTNPKLNHFYTNRVIDPHKRFASWTRPLDEPQLSDASTAEVEPDHIEQAVRKERNLKTPVQGTLRAIDSMGPWSGASIAAQLKVPALAVVERDLWLQSGASGASRPSDVDAKTQQRHSMGAGGLMRGQGTQPSTWTLGIWGGV